MRKYNSDIFFGDVSILVEVITITLSLIVTYMSNTSLIFDSNFE